MDSINSFTKSFISFLCKFSNNSIFELILNLKLVLDHYLLDDLARNFIYGYLIEVIFDVII